MGTIKRAAIGGVTNASTVLTGINHITLATEKLTESIEFYAALGFVPHVRWEKGAYLSLNELWLCLSKGKVNSKHDYSHLAFSIEKSEFEKMRSFLSANGAKEWQKNISEGNSIYFLDPNGHKLEVHVGDLESRLSELRKNPYVGMEWL